MRVFLCLLGLFFTGCSNGPAPLRIYTACEVEEAKRFLRTFEQATGERIRFVRLSTGEVLARIRAEAARPQVALWLCGPSSEHAVAEAEGLLLPYQPSSDFPLPPDAHSPTWGWTGWAKGVIGLAVNTDFLKAHNLSPPQSYADLLRPEYTGKISLAYPHTSGTASTILFSLVRLMGEESAFDYIKQLDRQVHHYNKSGAACITQAGLGEVAVCIAFAQDIRSTGIDQGYPLTLAYPREGAGYLVEAVSLVKGGNDLPRARRLIDWLLSREAQELLAQWHLIPLHPLAKKTATVETMAAVQQVPMGTAISPQEHERLLAKWRGVTGR